MHRVWAEDETGPPPTRRGKHRTPLARPGVEECRHAVGGGGGEHRPVGRESHAIDRRATAGKDGERRAVVRVPQSQGPVVDRGDDGAPVGRRRHAQDFPRPGVEDECGAIDGGARTAHLDRHQGAVPHRDEAWHLGRPGQSGPKAPRLRGIPPLDGRTDTVERGGVELTPRGVALPAGLVTRRCLGDPRPIGVDRIAGDAGDRDDEAEKRPREGRGAGAMAAGHTEERFDEARWTGLDGKACEKATEVVGQCGRRRIPITGTLPQTAVDDPGERRRDRSVDRVQAGGVGPLHDRRDLRE